MKSKKIKTPSKKAQSEMMGFAVILVIVSVLVVMFISFGVNDEPTDSQSEKIKTFLESFSEVTTPCEYRNAENYMSMKKLISMCDREEICYNEDSACIVMNETVEKIMESSWSVGESSPIKGYILKLYTSDPILTKQDGIETRNKETSSLTFPSGDNLFMQLTVYS